MVKDKILCQDPWQFGVIKGTSPGIYPWGSDQRIGLGEWELPAKEPRVCGVCIYIYIFFFVFLLFLGPLLWHMEVPRLGVQSEL